MNELKQLVNNRNNSNLFENKVSIKNLKSNIQKLESSLPNNILYLVCKCKYKKFYDPAFIHIGN